MYEKGEKRHPYHTITWSLSSSFPLIPVSLLSFLIQAFHDICWFDGINLTRSKSRDC